MTTTEAQKAATYRWRDKHREDYNERQNDYYWKSREKLHDKRVADKAFWLNYWAHVHNGTVSESEQQEAARRTQEFLAHTKS